MQTGVISEVIKKNNKTAGTIAELKAGKHN
jgi:hypothetical protein